jgi:hypothetical protein
MDESSFVPTSTMGSSSPAGRELISIGNLFKSTWEYYKLHFKRLMKISAVMWVIMIASYAAMGLVIDLSNTKNLTPPVIVVVVIALIITIGAAIWQQVALLYGMTAEGETKGVSETYKNSRRWLIPYLWVSILSSILIVLGTVVLIIPGIILGVWFSVATYIVVAENQSGVAALKSSKNYVKGRWSKVFWRWIVILLVGLTASIVTSIIGSVVGKTIQPIFDIIASILYTPLVLIYGYKLYQSLKETI